MSGKPVDLGRWAQGGCAIVVSVLLVLWAIWLTGCNGKVGGYPITLNYSDWLGVQHATKSTVPITTSSAAVRISAASEPISSEWRIVSGRDGGLHSEDNQYARGAIADNADGYLHIPGLDGRYPDSDAGQCATPGDSASDVQFDVVDAWLWSNLRSRLSAGSVSGDGDGGEQCSDSGIYSAAAH